MTYCSRFIAAVIVSLLFLFPAGAVGGEEAGIPASDDGAPARTSMASLREAPALPVTLHGAFMGSVDDVIVVAGGVTQVPETGVPAATNFSPAVYYLEPDAENWRSAGFEIRAAFGAAAVLDNALFCFGGFAPDGLSAQALRIVCEKTDDDGVRLKLETLTDLPVPTALAGVAVRGGQAFLMGGLTDIESLELSAKLYRMPLPRRPVKKKFSLMHQLKRLYSAIGRGVKSLFVRKSAGTDAGADSGAAAARAWTEEGEWGDGAGVLKPVLGVLRDENLLQAALYISGGWSKSDGAELFKPQAVTREYVPRGTPKAGWYDVTQPPAAGVFTDVMSVGPSHLLFTGLTGLDPADLRGVMLRREPIAPVSALYHNITERWVSVPVKNDDPQWANLEAYAVHTLKAATKRDPGRLVLVAESANSGQHRTRVWLGRLAYRERHFGIVDYGTLALYMCALIGIGIYFSKKEKGTDDFFLGGRRIPWWAAGLSMYATGISAISFMAIPAKTFATNWLYIPLGIFPVFAGLLAAYVFVPLLRRLNVTTIMEYTELRFNKAVRTILSIKAVAIQILGRMAVTLLLPSIALAAVTGWDIFACILVMGVFATIYTIMGGIGAVIWTDVLQVVVLFGGAILSLIVIVRGVDGGFGGAVKTCIEFNKFRAADLTFDIRIPTVLVFSLWGFGELFSKMGDQQVLQRAFSTDSVKSARKSVLTFTLISIPGTLLFYSLGAALFAYYRGHAHELNPSLPSIDSTFPLFIVQNLPAGVAGLVIAGLFAAAMSTLDSSMNMVSTIVVKDWYAVFGKGASEERKLSVARWITLITGILGTGTAAYLAVFSKGSLWDTFSVIMGLIGGALGGMMVLGMFTTRASGRGVLCAMPINLAFLLYVKLFTKVHFFTYGAIMLVVGFCVGYVLSLLLPDPRKKDLTGLTLWTPAR